MMIKHLCIVPCYNESENLDSLFDDIIKTKIYENFDILFIDDCSTDATARIIENAGWKVIKHEKNQGYGGSVKTGLDYAYKHNYDLMCLFPGDHQRSAKDIYRLLDEIESLGVDVVVGSKFHIYSSKYGPIGRRFGNRIFSNLARYGWGSPIQDVLSGFKMYRVKSIYPLSKYLPNGYPLDIVFSFVASQTGITMSEIPVDCKYGPNTSKMRSVILVSAKIAIRLIYSIILFYFERSSISAITRREPYNVKS